MRRGSPFAGSFIATRQRTLARSKWRNYAQAALIAIGISGAAEMFRPYSRPRMVRLIEDLASDWRRLDERVESLSSEIEAVARQDGDCERLMSAPGIGPIISSAMAVSAARPKAAATIAGRGGG